MDTILYLSQNFICCEWNILNTSHWNDDTTDDGTNQQKSTSDKIQY